MGPKPFLKGDLMLQPCAAVAAKLQGNYLQSKGAANPNSSSADMNEEKQCIRCDHYLYFTWVGKSLKHHHLYSPGTLQ
jgi:hypothetical protein